MTKKTSSAREVANVRGLVATYADARYTLFSPDADAATTRIAIANAKAIKPVKSAQLVINRVPLADAIRWVLPDAVPPCRIHDAGLQQELLLLFIVGQFEVMGFLSILISNALLSALSIAELGLISSMVGFILDQKHHVRTYTVDWPDQTVQLVVLPTDKNLWTDHGHASNGLAGYGFFLGLFGVIVAFRQRSRVGKPPSKTLLALIILQILAVLFALAVLIFVFVVTYETQGQRIQESIATSGVPYPADKWTPETWFKAVLELPLADKQRSNMISRNVTIMVAWRWILIPLFLLHVLALGCSVFEYVRQRKALRNGEQFEQVSPFKPE
ncbi:hypothetical protein DM02DRAFT_731001 [Periconia macrospinosa]|uniref:Uncharacterized protein n=1 Tax=Periconia macrospinosa TaxID=97972 RepID=A0A2V1DFA3_9PLEO|nr:hypothetical protein DM02DRAFT_731001 [Periconia macrospinosa]